MRTALSTAHLTGPRNATARQGRLGGAGRGYRGGLWVNAAGGEQRGPLGPPEAGLPLLLRVATVQQGLAHATTTGGDSGGAGGFALCTHRT